MTIHDASPCDVVVDNDSEPVEVVFKPNDIQLIQIKFQKIIGIDPPIEKQLISAGIDLPLRINIDSWSRDALMLFLATHPFVVRASTSGYYCISGFKSFRLAQALLTNPDVLVNVLLRPGKLSTQARRRLIAIEVFCGSAIFRMDSSESVEIYKLWRKLGSDDSILNGNTDRAFNLAMGFKFRNKK